MRSVQIESTSTGNQKWKRRKGAASLTVGPAKRNSLLMGPLVQKRCQVAKVAGGMEGIASERINNDHHQIKIFRKQRWMGLFKCPRLGPGMRLLIRARILPQAHPGIQFK